MQKKHPSGGASPTILQLKDAISFIDALSQEGADKIEAIVELCLIALESPKCRTENIAQALLAIGDISNTIQNCINSHAEDFGSNHRNERQRHRYAAYQASRQEVQS